MIRVITFFLFLDVLPSALWAQKIVVENLIDQNLLLDSYENRIEIASDNCKGDELNLSVSAGELKGGNGSYRYVYKKGGDPYVSFTVSNKDSVLLQKTIFVADYNGNELCMRTFSGKLTAEDFMGGAWYKNPVNSYSMQKVTELQIGVKQSDGYFNTLILKGAETDNAYQKLAQFRKKQLTIESLKYLDEHGREQKAVKVAPCWCPEPFVKNSTVKKVALRNVSNETIDILKYPAMYVTAGGESDYSISRNSLLALKSLMVHSSIGGNTFGFRPSGFGLYIRRLNGTIERYGSSSALFTAQMRSAMQSLKSGEVVSFINIQVKNSHAMQKTANRSYIIE